MRRREMLGVLGAAAGMAILPASVLLLLHKRSFVQCFAALVFAKLSVLHKPIALLV